MLIYNVMGFNRFLVVSLALLVVAPVIGAVEPSALPEPLAAIQPTKAKPVKLTDVDTATLRKAYEKWISETPAEKLGKHPLAEDFPGAPAADAPRVTRKVTIDPAVTRWHSTGLYAAPGDVITVTVPAAATSLKLTARIGSHKDRLWGYKPTEKWERFPQLDNSKKIDSTETKLACPFGGLVYIDVPSDTKAAPFEVTIANAVEAPLFELGKTDAKAWAATIRNRPAPWAELATRKIILTIPAKDAAALEDPTELLKTWDRCVASCEELAGRPCHKTSPERFVFDRQISAGWMHSGYPIMAHLASVKEVAVLKELQAAPWGPFHEIGHNFQQGAWTNGFNGEVSNNLFPLYVREKTFNLGYGGHPAIRPEQTEKRLNVLFKQPQADRNADVFDRLFMYVLISRDFGWPTWTAIWKEYDALPKNQNPKTDVDENTQWIIRMSKQTKHNLGPYCREWNLPANYDGLKEIETLPKWMPKDFPQKYQGEAKPTAKGELLGKPAARVPGT